MACRELRDGIPLSAMFGSGVRGTSDRRACCDLCARLDRVLQLFVPRLVTLEDSGQACDCCGGEHPSRGCQRPRPVQRRALRIPGALLAEAEDRHGHVCGVGECVEGRRMSLNGNHVSLAEHPRPYYEERGQPGAGEPGAISVADSHIPQQVKWIEAAAAPSLPGDAYAAGVVPSACIPVGGGELIVSLRRITALIAGQPVQPLLYGHLVVVDDVIGEPSKTYFFGPACGIVGVVVNLAVVQVNAAVRAMFGQQDQGRSSGRVQIQCHPGGVVQPGSAQVEPAADMRFRTVDPAARIQVLADHVLADGEPAGRQRRTGIVCELRPLKVEVSADAGAGQADLAACREAVAAEHVPAYGEPVGVKCRTVLVWSVVVREFRPLEVEVSADAGAGQADLPYRGEELGLAASGRGLMTEHVLAYGQPVSVKCRTVLIWSVMVRGFRSREVRLVEMEVSADVGTDQADFADRGEAIAAEHVVADGEPVGSQGGSVVVGDARAVQMEAPADPGAGQNHLSARGEYAVEEYVTGGPKLPGCEPGQVGAGQADRGRGGVAEIGWFIKVAIPQHQRALEGNGFHVEPASDARAAQPNRPQAAPFGSPFPSEHCAQQVSSDRPARGPVSSAGGIVQFRFSGPYVSEVSRRGLAHQFAFGIAQVGGGRHGSGAPRICSAVVPRAYVGAPPNGGGLGDVVDGGGPAGCVGDGHAEQVAQGADVSAGGLDFLVDAVQADVLGGDGELLADPVRGDRAGRLPAASVDEQVGVDTGRPGHGPVREVGVDAVADGHGQQDHPVIQVKPAAADVDELEPSQLPHRDGVVGEQGGDHGAGRAGRVQGLPQGRQVDRGRDRHGLGGDVNAEGGVGEDQLAGSQDTEDRPQALDHGGAVLPRGRQGAEDVSDGDLEQG